MGIDLTKPMAEIDAQFRHEAIVIMILAFGITATVFDIVFLVV